jgi:hypothetical protein
MQQFLAKSVDGLDLQPAGRFDRLGEQLPRQFQTHRSGGLVLDTDQFGGEAGIVHYGTDVITDATRTISALLGASPGASVSVNIVLEVIKKCFPQLLANPEGHSRMKEMIPTYDEDIKLPAHADRFHTVRKRTDEILQLGTPSFSQFTS